MAKRYAYRRRTLAGAFEHPTFKAARGEGKYAGYVPGGIPGRRRRRGPVGNVLYDSGQQGDRGDPGEVGHQRKRQSEREAREYEGAKTKYLVRERRGESEREHGRRKELATMGQRESARTRFSTLLSNRLKLGKKAPSAEEIKELRRLSGDMPTGGVATPATAAQQRMKRHLATQKTLRESRVSGAQRDLASAQRRERGLMDWAAQPTPAGGMPPQAQRPQPFFTYTAPGGQMQQYPAGGTQETSAQQMQRINQEIQQAQDRLLQAANQPAGQPAAPQAAQDAPQPGQAPAGTSLESWRSVSPDAEAANANRIAVAKMEMADQLARDRMRFNFMGGQQIVAARQAAMNSVLGTLMQNQPNTPMEQILATARATVEQMFPPGAPGQPQQPAMAPPMGAAPSMPTAPQPAQPGVVSGLGVPPVFGAPAIGGAGMPGPAAMPPPAAPGPSPLALTPGTSPITQARLGETAARTGQVRAQTEQTQLGTQYMREQGAPLSPADVAETASIAGTLRLDQGTTMPRSGSESHTAWSQRIARRGQDYRATLAQARTPAGRRQLAREIASSQEFMDLQEIASKAPEDFQSPWWWSSTAGRTDVGRADWRQAAQAITAARQIIQAVRQGSIAQPTTRPAAR